MLKLGLLINSLIKNISNQSLKKFIKELEVSIE